MTSASVYIAVPLTKVICVQGVTHNVTRYDEKTGEPYQKKVTENRLIVAGKDITDDLQGYIDKYGFEKVAYSSEFLEDRMPEGLEYIHGSEHDHPTDALAGFAIGGGCDDSDTPEIMADQKEVENAFEKMRQSLKAVELQHLEPKMYIQVVY